MPTIAEGTKNFSFEDLSSKSSAITKLKKAFIKLGAEVASVDVDSKIKRQDGVSYREVFITFADSQTVTLKINRTGDIFRVQINGKDRPIYNQTNQTEALKEIVNYLDKGRNAFQRMLLRKQRVSIKEAGLTVSKKQEDASIIENIDEERKQIDELKALIAEENAKIKKLQEEVKQYTLT